MKLIFYYDRSYYENEIFITWWEIFVNIYMKYLNGEYYVEVKEYRYKIRPTENNVLRKRNEPKSLRTQY